MASQVVLVREFFIVFHGNELSIGIILGLWLILCSIGAGALGFLTDRIKHKILTISACQFLLGILLPLSVIQVRLIRPIIGVSPAEIIGIPPILFSGIFILSFLCLIYGFLFSLSCRAYEILNVTGSKRIGYVYILEAVGASIGGLLVSLIFIRFLNSLTIMIILSISNLLLAVALSVRSKENLLAKRIISALSILLILFLIFSAGLKGIDKFNEGLVRLQWKPYNLLDFKSSIYGNIVVAKENEQVSFFDNGLHLFSVPDELSSEEQAHFAMLMHPDPKNILIIGGGIGGILKEALKYNVNKVDYVELDPLVIQMAKDHLKEKDLNVLRDSRVQIRHMDGRLYVKRANLKYDCIIINAPEPFTAQLNRLYTLEFFRELKLILSETGIVSFGLTSSENYIGKELQDFLSCIYSTLKNVFKDVKVIPGDTAYFLSSNKESILTYDYNLLSERIKSRDINLKFVREYYLFSKMSPERISYIEDRLKQKGSISLNLDFKPVCYFYDIVLWMTYFNSKFKDILKATSEFKIWIFFSVFVAALFLLSIRTKKSFNRKPYLISIMTTGTSEIVFQIVVLLSFQVLYGFVYYKLGLILTSFMIGLAIGSFLITKYLTDIKNDRRLFIFIQIAICIYPLILPPLFLLLSKTKSPLLAWLGSNIIFSFLPIIAGFIGGVQFPLANKVCLQNQEVGKTAGTTYGVDLLGACIGAFFASIFLIPILGIIKTCILIFLLNVATLIILLVNE
jgi:spermidine synthase